MDLSCLLPAEILSTILEFVSIPDLVRLERTCKLLQAYSLHEIERRISKHTSQEEWGVLVHLAQANAKLSYFDRLTKKAYYSISMDPIKINTMFEHTRPIHVSLLRKANLPTKTADGLKPRKIQPYCSQDSFVITVQKGMVEGSTVEQSIKSQRCEVNAALTRTPSSPPPVRLTSAKTLNHAGKQQKPIPIAPVPITYTLQITELSIPLSTIAL
ncbi:hypothetical protein K501DRAFT_334163 [Backusella circina FSU 941]|nr:hypothetical protein K501DRAFT_334163 [Backusella circina FSU 941]